MRIPFAFLFLLMLLPACSGPKETSKEPERTTERTKARPADSKPAATKPAAPRRVTMQGFRIQVQNTTEKTAAEQEGERVAAWWKTLPASRRPKGLGDGGPAVYIDWRQPYYRVRIGDFASRDEAERARVALTSRYPNAIIVPDTVTVIR